MRILEKNKIGERWVNFIFRSSLTIAIIFNIVAVGRAKAEDVNNFDGLQNAIGDSNKNYIDINQNISFDNEIAINRSNLTISGPEGVEEVKLNGSGQHRFFTIGEDQKNISLKNLHLENGSSGVGSDHNSGGGAIHLNAGVVVNLEGLTFSNNQTRSLGGAIYSWGTNNDNRNSLNFTGKTIFDGNKTIVATNNGGAIFAYYSTLTFGGGPTIFRGNSSAVNGGAIYGYYGTKLIFGENVTFTENNSAGNGGAIRSYGENATNKNILKFEGNATFVGNSANKDGYGGHSYNGDGGAIYAKDSSLTFGKLLATFENNSSIGSGGAIYGYHGTKLIFSGDVIFRKNSSVDSGGAIRFQGLDANDRNSFEFKGNATFVRNSTTEGGNGNGGAIFVENSSLTFEKLATFENNGSRGDGGAICGNHGTELTFGGEVIFTENSSAGAGGAIRSRGKNAANKNILKFEGNATFVGNSANKDGYGGHSYNGYGGAIFVENSSLTFGGLATFENNRARCGGAIFAYSSASIEFNDGL
ncbi:MAG: hypothetical protein LBB13_03835, partial [Rickettsiales bacterium]|nr:hypothetical protein [Rickettsiales bacterium]